MTKPAKLSQKQIRQRLAKLDGWKRRGNAITKEFVLSSFTGAAKFIGKMAHPANAMDHHPDLQLHKYKRVKVVLTTHSVGGLTRDDFVLAAKIDTLPV